MRELRERSRLLTPDFALMLLLLFWIPMENTILGRGYTHVLGLNAAGASKASLKTEIAVICFQATFLFTIFVPTIIGVLGTRAQKKPGPMFAVRVGLGIWLAGTSISTLAHFDNALVILNYAAGMLSGAAVFFAIRRVKLTTMRHFEYAFRAMTFGILIPCLIDLFRYYRAWGIPSLSRMIDHKYVVGFWSVNSFFGNPDNACGMYSFFASMCIVVLFAKMFSTPTRWLAGVTLVVATVFSGLTMARTGICFYFVAFFLTAIFVRANRMMLVAAVCAGLLAFSLSNTRGMVLWKYIHPALTYDQQDKSVASRIESMKEGWSEFLDSPFIGVGPNQSFRVIEEEVAHELAISQADENGVLGFIGVIIVTIACLWRLMVLVRKGAGSTRDALEFLFLIGPALYFARGAVAGVAVNITVVNSFICMTFASLAIVDRPLLQGTAPVWVLVRPYLYPAEGTAR